MGIMTAEHADRLYWLGRYTERVYSTINFFTDSFDRALAHDPQACADFCRKLDIPNIYHGLADFLRRYNFDKTNPDSVVSNLERVYDNAVVMRDELGSDAICYVQMAVYALEHAAASETPYLDMVKVSDNILAFWGIVDDQIESENVRNIIKVGKRIERIDLYARLSMPREALKREINRLVGRIGRTNLRYNAQRLNMLRPMVEQEEIPYRAIVTCVDSLLDTE
ncbi:MAG: alpha-E domain-containing protein [Aristaeellaceae bacterium]